MVWGERDSPKLSFASPGYLQPLASDGSLQPSQGQRVKAGFGAVSIPRALDSWPWGALGLKMCLLRGCVPLAALTGLFQLLGKVESCVLCLCSFSPSVGRGGGGVSWLFEAKGDTIWSRAAFAVPCGRAERL